MKSERGFTLIELLVVIAIMAVLFGVTALALTGVGSNAEAEAARAEADVVQTAIDVYMAVTNSGSIAPQVCTQAGPGTTGFGDYLRRTSRFYLGWDGSGTVTGVFDAAGCSSGDQLWP